MFSGLEIEAGGSPTRQDALAFVQLRVEEVLSGNMEKETEGTMLGITATGITGFTHRAQKEPHQRTKESQCSFSEH